MTERIEGPYTLSKEIGAEFYRVRDPEGHILEQQVEMRLTREQADHMVRCINAAFAAGRKQMEDEINEVAESITDPLQPGEFTFYWLRHYEQMEIIGYSSNNRVGYGGNFTQALRSAATQENSPND